MQGGTTSAGRLANTVRRQSAAARAPWLKLNAALLLCSAVSEAHVQGNLHHVRARQRHRGHNAHSARTARKTLETAVSTMCQQPIIAPTLASCACLGAKDRCAVPLFWRMLMQVQMQMLACARVACPPA
ncbi:hypothetical protein SVAN01_03054 [Stagonosporopsis vannaccii]|nr:hypothetical protein SVAN01_03054 [Stagonosporopsis vannaccii]